MTAWFSERDALQQQLDSLLEGQNTESNTEEPLSNNETQANEQVLVEPKQHQDNLYGD